jgi:U3 small nucleolar RNA-associated protein 5
MSAKRKLPATLGKPQIKASAKALGNGDLDESRTVVTSGGNPVEPDVNGAEVVTISSDSESEHGDEEDSEADERAEEASPEEDVTMEDAGVADEAPKVHDEEDTEEIGEPSFGDLVRAHASEPIDVAGAFEDEDRALTYPQGNKLQAPSGASLGTVLNQALRTNDVQLLESCLHTSDVATIRATIQRLESPLAGTLLQKLAERLHRRPGRAGSLMAWVQWTIIAHGGYLATQKDLIKKLAQLNKVIDERAKGLQSLLSLKGKLDMLDAQIDLRKSMQRQRVDDDEDDEGVIYVEGQEDEEDEEPKPITANGDVEFSGSEASEDMPTTNGVTADSEDEEEDSDGDGLLDDEAQETDADSGDEDEVDFDDQDSDGEEVESDDDVAAAPPAKMQRKQ